VQLVGETVELRQRGREFWGCCPFHHEKTPSFKVIPTTGLWHCFGCSEGGDVFNYVMKRENLDFPDCHPLPGRPAGIELSEERAPRAGPQEAPPHRVPHEAETFYTTMLMRARRGPAAARALPLGARLRLGRVPPLELGLRARARLARLAPAREGLLAQELVAADLAPGALGAALRTGSSTG
jgi:DNA primase